MMQHVTRFKKMVIFLMAFVMICTTANVSAATTYKKAEEPADTEAVRIKYTLTVC